MGCRVQDECEGVGFDNQHSQSRWGPPAGRRQVRGKRRRRWQQRQNTHLYGGGPCIQRVLHELLHCRGQVQDDLPRTDTVDSILGYWSNHRLSAAAFAASNINISLVLLARLLISRRLQWMLLLMDAQSVCSCSCGRPLHRTTQF